MADSHLQVNYDGTVSDERTNLLPNSKEFKTNLLRQLFTINNWRVESIDNPTGCLWKIVVRNNTDSEYKINLLLSSIRDEARQPDEFKTQFGGKIEFSNIEDGWVNIPLGVYMKEADAPLNKCLFAAFSIEGINFLGNPSFRGVRTKGLQLAQSIGFIENENCIVFRPEFIYYVVNIYARKQSNVYNSEFVEDKPLGTESLQVIYYGAPGTGKSYEINRQRAGYPTFRTTFHPDSDYASFVGAYKPISKKGNWVTRAVDRSGEILTEKVLKDNEGKVVSDSKIVYEYTFQTFLKAYQKAWEEQTKENPSKVFLVIEELNRGNCAQIFGDLFQLLDRNENGFSQYAIDADSDMGAELGAVLKNLDIHNPDFINSQYPGTEDMVSDVKEGRKLLLPNNLHIWATMNTSDQSLFPIDSAFKRRWDWKYVKISDAGLDYKIAVNSNEYDWWSFIKSINYMIGKDLDQEDKQLGYFFAKTNRDENGNYLISADSFLSKVIFFIYNDVYKDYGFDDAIFQDEEGELIEFADYFDDMGNADQEKVERFVKNVIKKGEDLKLISYTPSPEDETAD